MMKPWVYQYISKMLGGKYTKYHRNALATTEYNIAMY